MAWKYGDDPENEIAATPRRRFFEITGRSAILDEDVDEYLDLWGRTAGAALVIDPEPPRRTKPYIYKPAPKPKPAPTPEPEPAPEPEPTPAPEPRPMSNWERHELYARAKLERSVIWAEYDPETCAFSMDQLKAYIMISEFKGESPAFTNQQLQKMMKVTRVR